MQLEGTLDLVSKAQDGDEIATESLIKIIKNYHMPRYVGKYRGRNVLIDDADIESEFLMGAFKALNQAKLDLGNPINFICWKGSKAVQSLFRTRLRNEVNYQCLSCGHEGLIGWKYKTPVCKSCDSDDIHTWMMTIQASDTNDSLEEFTSSRRMSADYAWQLAVHGIQIEEMRARLSGRALELFDIIIFEGINRDSSKNYLQEIANRWGVSTTAVAMALRKLRRDILIYIEA